MHVFWDLFYFALCLANFYIADDLLLNNESAN